MARIALRGTVGALALVLLAGCSSTPDEEMPQLVAIRLEEGSSQQAKDRTVLKRLLGRESQSIGQMMAKCVEDELFTDGISARSPAVASRGTRDEALEALRGDGGERALLIVSVGTWDLEGIATSGEASVEYEFLLLGADGHEIWDEDVSRRSVKLRAGEQRDIEALVRRLAAESLRSRPLRTRPAR